MGHQQVQLYPVSVRLAAAAQKRKICSSFPTRLSHRISGLLTQWKENATGLKGVWWDIRVCTRGKPSILVVSINVCCFDSRVRGKRNISVRHVMSWMLGYSSAYFTSTFSYILFDQLAVSHDWTPVHCRDGMLAYISQVCWSRVLLWDRTCNSRCTQSVFFFMLLLIMLKALLFRTTYLFWPFPKDDCTVMQVHTVKSTEFLIIFRRWNKIWIKTSSSHTHKGLHKYTVEWFNKNVKEKNKVSYCEHQTSGFSSNLVDDVWISWKGYVQFEVRDSWECLCHLLLLLLCAICVHARYSSVTGLREDFQSKSSLENCLKCSRQYLVSSCCVLSFLLLLLSELSAVHSPLQMGDVF